MKIFDETLSRVERSLDVRLQRHGVLAGNLANMDTPGFRPKDIDFASVMSSTVSGESGLSRTDAQHFDVDGGSAGVSPDGRTTHAPARVIEAGGSTPTMDGNQVDLDRTMASMAENAVQYSASTKAATKKLAILRYVAADGNG